MFLFSELKLLYIIVPGTGSNSFSAGMKKRYNYNNIHGNINILKDLPVVGSCWSGKVAEAAQLHPDVILSQHCTAKQAKILVKPEIWDSYEKIAFVREPFAWAKSLYRKTGLKEGVGIDDTGTFLEFLEKLEKTPLFWMTDQKGKMLIDTVYRTEDLEQICMKFGIKYLQLNRTKSAREVKRTPEVDEILQKKFWREYKYYTERPIICSHV